MKESHRRVINGEEFEVGVETGTKDGNRYRRVYMYHVRTAEEKGHSYMCADKKYYEKSGGLFSEAKPLPPEDEHIVEVVNEGASLWFNIEEQSEQLEDQIMAAMRAADDVYDESV